MYLVGRELELAEHRILSGLRNHGESVDEDHS